MTQENRVLKHLKDFGSITSWEAIMEYGVTRLSAVIFNLRKEYNIKGTTVTAKNRYGEPVHYTRYTLEEE